MSAARPLRIFVVENHIDTLKWLTLYLQQMGHTVTSARTMSEALAVLPKASCEVLISDIGLPDGDGWELLQRVREGGRGLPGYSIAMSGYGMNSDRSKSKATGYSQHILKPFKAAELQRMLGEAVRTLDQ
jgi:CheY-like chemotaxis protein